MKALVLIFASIGTAVVAQEQSRPLPPVEEFIAAKNFHGMQYEAAARYGPEAIDALRRVLSDPEGSASWSPAVWVLGVIATPEAVEALIAFHENGVEGTADPRELNALLLVPQALGFAAQDPESRAFAYLREGLQMKEGQGQIAWTGQSWAPGSREILLAKLSANGLGLAGNAEGRALLEETRSELSRSDPERMRYLQPNVEEALALSARIEREGYARALTPPQREAGPKVPRAPDPQ